MAKTVENSLQVNVLRISKAVRQAHSGVLTLEWVFGAMVISGIVVLTDDTLTVLVGGTAYQAAISCREFRKNRYLTYVQCVACARKCFSLFIEGGCLQCRSCAGLIYECQRVHAADRSLLKAQRIMMRLGGNIGLTIPPRPARMWRKTYLRYIKQLDEVQRDAFGLPRPEATFRLI